MITADYATADEGLAALRAFRHKIAATLAPAIDCNAPYAKVMVEKLVEIANEEAKPHIAEIERLKVWVADLQSGMYVNCVYCGHRYGPGETTPVTMADALKAHVAQCAEHPMARLVNTLKGASYALKSYAYGNASHDLAQSAAAACDEAVANATRASK